MVNKLYQHLTTDKQLSLYSVCSYTINLTPGITITIVIIHTVTVITLVLLSHYCGVQLTSTPITVKTTVGLL